MNDLEFQNQTPLQYLPLWKLLLAGSDHAIQNLLKIFFVRLIIYSFVISCFLPRINIFESLNLHFLALPNYELSNYEPRTTQHEQSNYELPIYELINNVLSYSAFLPIPKYINRLLSMFSDHNVSSIKITGVSSGFHAWESGLSNSFHSVMMSSASPPLMRHNSSQKIPLLGNSALALVSAIGSCART